LDKAVDMEGNTKAYLSDIRITSGSSFFENRAWIAYDEIIDGRAIDIVALIDTQGNTLWKSDPADGSALYGMDITDGLSYVRYGVDGNGYADKYCIIDINGNVTYTITAEDIKILNYVQTYKDFQILGYGGGQFLAMRYVSNFDISEWQIGAIDRYGELVSPFISYKDSFGNALSVDEIRMVEYMGDDIFYLSFLDSSAPALLNMETNEVICNDNNIFHYMSFYSDFEDGYATIAYTSEYFHDNVVKPGIYKFGTDGKLHDFITDDWLRGNVSFSENLIFCGDAYYDITGKKIISFPKYEGSKNYKCGDFDNDLAVMGIQGADSSWYYTVIDKSGTELFAPIKKFDDFSLYLSENYFVGLWQKELLDGIP